MQISLIRPYLAGFLVLLCLMTLTGSVRLSDLERIKARGEMVVVTRNAPTTFYEDRTGPAGYELELARAFADYLGVDLRIIVADNYQDIFSTLETGKAAFAAAGLTHTQERERFVRFSNPYKFVDEVVVYRRGDKRPASFNEMTNGRLVVTSFSSHAETLRQHQKNDAPELTWSESPDLETADLLQMVTNGTIDYTIVDSNEFRMLQAYHPQLSVAFESSSQNRIAWAFSHQRDDSLYQAANAFFAEVRPTPLLATLSERYYGHLDKLDYVGAIHFWRQTNNKLEKFKPHFIQAADEHGFDWRLLAAVGYQESHWNPAARSFTGVRGLMMLTRKTASELGVTNRLDAQQSIAGGSKYLARLRERLGQEVQEPDRTWLALAAYNVGFGHLSDARRITEKLGGNPNSWLDVKESLPLLSQKRYYRYTRHGYARGQEPVDYVQNIRRYYDVLVWNDEQTPFSEGTLEEVLASSPPRIIPPLL